MAAAMSANDDATKRRGLMLLLAVFPPPGGTDVATIQLAVEAHLLAARVIDADIFAVACETVLGTWSGRYLPPPFEIKKVCEKLMRAKRDSDARAAREREERSMRSQQMTPEQAVDLLTKMQPCDAPHGSVARLLHDFERGILRRVAGGRAPIDEE